MKAGYWAVFSVAAAAAVLLAPMGAQAGVGDEVLYLADSGGLGTTLFRVDLDWVWHQADLSPLPDVGYGPGIIPFEYAKAIASTPDGARIYCIDQYAAPQANGTGKLGYYDVASPSWHEVGYVADSSGNMIYGIVLAAFSPDGVLYLASENYDVLYVVDIWTAQVTPVGAIIDADTGATVNVSGADIAFTADGALYLWTNGKRAGAPEGLYALTVPASPGPVYGKWLGGQMDTFFTGLAVRANGFGDLVGSENTKDQIVVVSKADGSAVDTFDMYLAGERYDYRFGDMTSGPLALCTATIGYWKNHSWDGASVSICGVPVNELLGKTILKGANGTNFSMLIAQLIAAKLNTFNATGLAVIDGAEAWLCAQGVVIYDGYGNPIGLDWQKPFASKQQKAGAVYYKDGLDWFNNLYECD